ncbi:MAG: glycosyltransferase family 9 protein, partial [Chlamydiae bacterium]|nr:glycosyltransferase family 9 protein [Chlamydiota bacterium]
AHIGDVILTTSLLKPIKEAFPNMKLGMLINSCARPIVEGQVDHLHIFDHWKLGGNSRDCKKVIEEIKGYSIAVDCNFHYPNSSPLLWQAKIPTRIGFTSAGFGPLLTHSYSWQTEDVPAPQIYARLLKPLGIDAVPTKPQIVTSAIEKKEYIVVHPCSRNARKEWPAAKWKELLQRFPKSQLLFTGRGKREKAFIESIIPANGTNLCDQLSWSEFVTTIAEGALLLTVDTSAGHIAAAVDTPVVAIHPAIHHEKLWKPYGEKVTVVRQNPDCSPCFTGCESMECIKTISVDRVYDAAQAMIPRPTSPRSS